MSELMVCPHCGGELTVTPDLQGFEVGCPHCQKMVWVPIDWLEAPPDQEQAVGNGQSSYDGTQIYSHQEHRGVRVHVPDYLVLSVLITLFCCVPVGIVAIIHSVDARNEKRYGDYREAWKDAKKARNYCWLCLGFGVVCLLVALIAKLVESF